MFAILGDSIVFEFVTSPERYGAEVTYDYAEHKVVQAKPVLQWVSDALEKITFDLRFHQEFCNPGTQLAALKNAADQHLAMPFVYGNGYHRGTFVIEKVAVVYEVMSDLGDLVSITVRVELKEWVKDTSPTATPPFQPGPGVQPTPVPVMPLQPGVVPAEPFQPTTQPIPLSTDNAGLSAVLNNPTPAGPASLATPYNQIPTSTITRAAP